MRRNTLANLRFPSLVYVRVHSRRGSLVLRVLLAFSYVKFSIKCGAILCPNLRFPSLVYVRVHSRRGSLVLRVLLAFSYVKFPIKCYAILCPNCVSPRSNISLSEREIVSIVANDESTDKKFFLEILDKTFKKWYANIVRSLRRSINRDELPSMRE